MAGKGRGVLSSDDGLFTCSKYFLFVFNLISLITGIIIFVLCMWMRYDWDFKVYVYKLEMYQVWTGIYVLIVVSAFVILVSFIGCCGAVTENPTILGMYGVALLVFLVLEIAGLAYLLDNSTMYSKFTWWMRDRMYRAIYLSDINEDEARVLRIVQENIGCCGSYSSLDYINVNKAVPKECRDPNTGNEYLDGCYIRFSRYLENRTGWIAGLSLFLAVLQVFGIIASFTLRRTIRKLEAEGKMYDPVKKGVH